MVSYLDILDLELIKQLMEQAHIHWVIILQTSAYTVNLKAEL